MVDDLSDIEILIPRANSGQRFLWAESTTRATADVVFPEQSRWAPGNCTSSSFIVMLGSIVAVEFIAGKPIAARTMRNVGAGTGDRLQLCGLGQ